MKLNRTKLSYGLVIMFLVSAQINANEKKKSYKDHDHKDKSGAYLKKGLTKTIFNSISNKSLERSHDRDRFQISPQLGIFNPSNFSLRTKYFHTSYKDNFGSMMLLKIEFLKNLGNFKNTEVSIVSSVGYSYKQGPNRTESNSGFKVEDTISFQWIPVMAGANFSLKFLSTPFFMPSIRTQVGASWFHQSGTIDGFNQGFWVPFYSIGSSFKFSFGKESNNSIINNITFGFDYQKDLDSEQNYEGIAYFIGINFST